MAGELESQQLTFCPDCGYQLTHFSDFVKCTLCGYSTRPPEPPPSSQSIPARRIDLKRRIQLFSCLGMVGSAIQIGAILFLSQTLIGAAIGDRTFWFFYLLLWCGGFVGSLLIFLNEFRRSMSPLP